MTQQPSCEQAGEHELSACRERARAVPAAPAVEQLRASGPGQTDEMLEIRRAGGECTDRRIVGNAPPSSEERDNGKSAHDFEASVVNVAMRDAIAGEMKWNAEQRSCSP
jgi:hypothetical protein